MAGAAISAWILCAGQLRSLPTARCRPQILPFGDRAQQPVPPIPNTTGLGTRISPRNGTCVMAGKYTTALRLGTAETEAILRRFTKQNLQHPTYKAFAELGKAIKTIFLCQYLHSEALRREIHDGLNVVEQWNGATDFVFFARRGEMASNRREDHEISMLALHLIQNCMGYINTLMIRKLLAQPHWQGKLTPRDYAALTPLIWEHVNPYGRFDLDMNTRLALL